MNQFFCKSSNSGKESMGGGLPQGRQKAVTYKRRLRGNGQGKMRMTEIQRRKKVREGTNVYSEGPRMELGWQREGLSHVHTVQTPTSHKLSTVVHALGSQHLRSRNRRITSSKLPLARSSSRPAWITWNPSSERERLGDPDCRNWRTKKKAMSTAD